MRPFLSLLALVTASVALAAPPNVVIIFADDLGYSDLGCYGAKGWTTPHLDQLAKDGVRFTDFHVSQPVCSASRTSLLTGCYANRLGIHGALGPTARHGIADAETTLGELFQSKGYATGMVGKWHLGHHERFLPPKHGFDSYLGLPYSNDMWPHQPEKQQFPPLPLIDGLKKIDTDVTAEDQAKLTTLYTERAVKFIEENKAKPFFLYIAHTMPHVPLYVSDKYKGKSEQGLYGDVIQEIDWSVGEVLTALKKHSLEENTLVIFTSDNGPWLSYGNHSGTKGQLREGKGSVWEGGVRVPCLARWPGKIPAGSVQTEPLMTIDIFPTLAKLIGAELPKLKIDGKEAWPLFACEKGAKCPQAAYWHYFGTNELQAIRSGKWKLILPHTCRMIEDRKPGANGKPAGYKQVKLEKPMLFDLEKDIGETTDVAATNPDVLAMMQKHAAEARAELGDSLTKAVGKGVRQPGRIPDEPKYSAELVFPLDQQHNHAPGIVECPNGDLLVSWYRGSGERTADDVVLLGARRKAGSDKWGEAFLMADTPGFPDCNTTMSIDRHGKLWLFWPVILANTWESCLTHYRVSSDYQKDTIKWEWQGNIPLKPKDFEKVMLAEFATWQKQVAGFTLPKSLTDEAVKQRVGDKLLSRLGWQPRCKPTVLKSGRILLPLYSDTYSAGIMAISDDDGQTWTASTPLAGFGSIQPSVLERQDGTLVAFMRENGVFKKIRMSESKDQGVTWDSVTNSELPNPGSGIDAVKLASGNWCLVYNDQTTGRSSLAVSLSDDEGKTWKWTRHLEKQTDGRFHYPAVIQGKDGTIHAVYSYFVPNGKSMRHAAFNEAWVKEGDGK